MNEIRFYRSGDPYGWLSNFSPHAIDLDGRRWPTVEHYFQAMKSEDPKRQQWIRGSTDPAQAKRRGRRRGLREDWHDVRDDVMRRAVAAKFDQHSDLAEKLIATGDALLIEDAPRDYYWGCGVDGSGENMLGQVLMEVRERLMRISGHVV
jgi:ribA/ribD-fused uncharacterized protein